MSDVYTVIMEKEVINIDILKAFVWFYLTLMFTLLIVI